MKQTNEKGQIELPADYHYYKAVADSRTGKLLLKFLHACQNCEKAADDWCKKFGAKYYCDNPKYFAGGVACVAFDSEPDPKLWRPYVRIGKDQYYLPACEAVPDKVEIPHRDYALKDSWDTMYLRDKIYEAPDKKLYLVRLSFRPVGDQKDSQGRPIQAGRKLRQAIAAEQKRLRLPVMTVQQLYRILEAELPVGRLTDRTPIVFLYGASLYIGSFYPCNANGLESITMQQCRTKACLWERQDGNTN